MKNLLHLCESSETGGAESVLVNIADNLDKRRYRSLVCLLSDGWLKQQLDRRNIETIIIPQPRSFDPGWLKQAHRLLKERDIHLMHSHEFATNVYASLLAKITGIPAVTTVHGKNYYGEKWRRRAAYRYAARHSTMVAVSHDMKRFLVERISIPPDKLRVIHNGIDLGRYAEQQADRAIRKKLGIRDGQPVIGTIGNLFAVKGQVHLLRACRDVARVFPDLVLLIAGEGDQRGMLEKEASDIGMADRVKFLGFRDDVPSLLQAMDVFVLPSLSEGLPLSVLEALSLKKPVVASDVGGIPEIIENGVTGYLVPPENPEALAEKITLLLQNPERAAVIGQAGRRRVEEDFSLPRMIREHQSLYEEICAGD
jgi:sugar transferase (PEP-CTERM/EpsH1 system associated)